MTFAELREQVLGLAYPSRMARNLIPLRKQHVQTGLTHIQRAVKCLQAKNVNRTGTTGLGHNCWWSETLAPQGHIYRARVEATPDNPCGPCRMVQLTFVSEDQFVGLAGDYGQRGVYNPVCWPVPRAWYTIFRNRVLRVYPSLQVGGWNLALEWQGVRKVWQDTDEIDLEGWEDVLEALRLFVLYRGLVDEGCTGEELKTAFELYNGELRQLVYDCRMQMEGERHEAFGSAVPPGGIQCWPLSPCGYEYGYGYSEA